MTGKTDNSPENASYCGRKGCCHYLETGNKHRIPHTCSIVWFGAVHSWEDSLETCQYISTHLLPHYVKIPEGTKLREIVDSFETCWGFLQAAGAIDGSHIPIIRPDESASDYYNQKGYYSIIMQAMVDFRGLFMDVCIGWPGKVHDARVFANSSLYHKGMSGSLFPDWKRLISGVQVHILIF